MNVTMIQKLRLVNLFELFSNLLCVKLYDLISLIYSFNKESKDESCNCCN